MMDEEGERFDEDNASGQHGLTSRMVLIESMVDKAVRERCVWLAAAAELRETEEVKRTGPASPAPCLQGRRKGEDAGRWQRSQTCASNYEFSDLSHLWGAYRPDGVVMGWDHTAVAMRDSDARSARGPATAKADRSARRQGASVECWLCGQRGCDCEASEGSCSAPVTPEQRTISMEQVTPERTGGAEGEFSLGPAAIGEKSERVIGTQTTGTQTTEEPTAADKEYTAVATDKGEIQEMKALMEELQAQVLRTERLAGMVDSWTVASPEVAVEGVNSAERYVQQKVSKKRMVRTAEAVEKGGQLGSSSKGGSSRGRSSRGSRADESQGGRSSSGAKEGTK